MIPDDELQAMRDCSTKVDVPATLFLPITVLKLLDEIDRLKAIIKQEAEDWAETDTAVRDVARKHFGEPVDGTPDVVPSIIDLIEQMDIELTDTHDENTAHWQYIAELKAELAAKEIRWTDAIPSCSGWWWRRGDKEQKESCVFVGEGWSPGELLVCLPHHSGLWKVESLGGQWSDKPIPMPEEP